VRLHCHIRVERTPPHVATQLFVALWRKVVRVLRQRLGFALHNSVQRDVNGHFAGHFVLRTMISQNLLGNGAALRDKEGRLFGVGTESLAGAGALNEEN